MKENSINYTIVFVVMLVGCAIGVKELIEPDLWWYMRTGEWILENTQVPATDFLSYTHFGVEWINVKWLYEVLIYTFSKIGGPEFVSVFQSIINVLIVWVLYGIYGQLSNSRKTGAWAFVTIAALAICSYRMTARPETISHLFSLLTILIYLLGKNKNLKWFYWWIPLQVLWTNMHEAYATGIVLMFSFAAWEVFLAVKQKQVILKTPIVYSTGLATLGICLNPRGYEMLLHPFEIFSQLNTNKYTTELLDYHSSIYWEKWQSVAFIIVLLLFGWFLVFSNGKQLKKSVQNALNTISGGYILILFLFIYLGFSAQRNIPFFILAISPILAIGLGNIIPKKIDKIVSITALLVGVVSYCFVVSNQFYTLTNSKYNFGLKVDSYYNPIGLGHKLQKIDYKQAHFSDYLTSSYILWKHKDYQSYIDLRDLDVFPASFFEEMLLVSQNYQAFKDLDAMNDFQYVYLKRLDFTGLIRNLNADSNWTMTYADPVACLFQKQKKATQSDVFKAPQQLEVSSLSSAINFILNPIKKEKVSPINMDFMAASFYNAIEDHELALNRLNKLTANTGFEYQSLCMQGRILTELGVRAQSDSLMAEGLSRTSKAKKLFPKKSEAFYTAGLQFYKQGLLNEAIIDLKLCVKRDKKNVDALSQLALCQNALAQVDPQNSAIYIAGWFKYMEQAYEIDPSNLMFAYQLGVSYCERNKCKKAKKYLEKLEELPFLNAAQNASIVSCKRKCLID